MTTAHHNNDFVCVIDNKEVDLTPVAESILNKKGRSLETMASLKLNLDVADMLTLICYITKKKAVQKEFFHGDVLWHGQLVHKN